MNKKYVIKADYATSSRVDEIESTATNLSDEINSLSEEIERTKQEICRLHQVQGETLEIVASEIYDSLAKTNDALVDTREIVESNSSSINGIEHSTHIRNRRVNKILVGMSIVSLLQMAAIILLAIWR